MKRHYFKIVNFYLRDNILTLKFLSSMIFVIGYLMPSLIRIADASDEVSLRMHFTGIFLLLSETWNLMVFFLGYLIIISNIPFKENIQKQVLIRMGKIRWLFNQLVYLICIAFIYFGSICLTITIILHDSIGFFSNWGQFLGGVSRGDGDLNQIVPNNLIVSKIIIENYAPYEYLTIIIMMMISILILFSLIVFVGNLYYKYCGFFIAGIVLFINVFSYANAGYLLFYLSPLTWISIQNISFDNYGKLPTWNYVILAIFGSMVILIFAIIYKGKNKGHFDY